MLILMTLLTACADDHTECASGACDSRGHSHEVAAVNGERNVVESPLVPCSTSPMTGFYRDGLCRTGPEDRGVHVVCAQVTEAFLADTASRGNDLSTPAPQFGFPGLNPGDGWCLCAARWEEARQGGVAPPVILQATSAAALTVVSREVLTEHAVVTP